MRRVGRVFQLPTGHPLERCTQLETPLLEEAKISPFLPKRTFGLLMMKLGMSLTCLLYTSDAADEEDSVDLGGRRIIKKKKNIKPCRNLVSQQLDNSLYRI
eukprot:TRINITY_DN11778_c0_g1_i2.p3 TRINITY_DN11778_c0_g1~~TRINITY_DN11778_c0_g1_i2.p3  ORF type:complete len:101 (+),score=10.28 TRINITY_DN11778_c0_g1_i2:612-914(+)